MEERVDSQETIRPVLWTVDTPDIIASMHAFWEETKMVGPYNPDFFVESTRKLVDLGVACFFTLVVDDVVAGGVGALVGPSAFHPAPSCTELFFYITPVYRTRHRFRLLHDALEEWARSKGAVEILLGNFEKEKGSLTAIYERMGYHQFNTMFYRRL